MDRFVSETTFYVRYAETDAMGIVHHASYIVYFEEGRSSYIRQRGSDYADFERAGYYLAVSEVVARYLKPARYGDRVTVTCWVEALQSRSMTYAYELRNAVTGDMLVTGQSKHICLSKEGQVVRIPNEWRVWIDPPKA